MKGLMLEETLSLCEHIVTKPGCGGGRDGGILCCKSQAFSVNQPTIVFSSAVTVLAETFKPSQVFLVCEGNPAFCQAF